MKNNFIERILKLWPYIPIGEQIRIGSKMVYAWVVLTLGGLIAGVAMKPKMWPRVVLVVGAIGYTLFAILFFDKYPTLIYVAGFIMGSVLTAALLIAIRNSKNGGGKPPK